MNLDVDPYTMELELCRDDGIVDLAMLNRFRRRDGLVEIDEAFPCTGHAHLASEHIRCISPSHQVRGRLELPAGVSVLSQRVEDGKLVLEIAVHRAAAERTVTAGVSQGAPAGAPAAAVHILHGIDELDLQLLARDLAPYMRSELDKPGRRRA